MIQYISEFFKKNLRLIAIIGVLIILIFGFYEFYNYLNLKKIKNTSRNYFEAIENININNSKSISILEEISKTKNGYSILSSMDLAKIHIDKKDYNKAYDIYTKLIDSKIDKLYKEIVIIHSSYNLINKVDKEMISSLINRVDIDKSSFKSHLYEIKYINSIDKINIVELNNLNIKIQSDIEILPSVKERIKSINEYIQNK
tara:strand:+ start:142 stop:744 length:603 start_codon:yes stop_codon:yes gene_type:complete